MNDNPFLQSQQQNVTQQSKHQVAQAAQVPQKHIFAGLWVRLMAWSIDVFLIVVPGVVMMMFFVTPEHIGYVIDHVYDTTFHIRILIALEILVGIAFIYHVLMVQLMQATIGKAFLGMRVVSNAGRTLFFGDIVRREGVKFLLLGIPLVGYILTMVSMSMIGLMSRRTSLHDVIASTVVAYVPQTKKIIVISIVVIILYGGLCGFGFLAIGKHADAYNDLRAQIFVKNETKNVEKARMEDKKPVTSYDVEMQKIEVMLADAETNLEAMLVANTLGDEVGMRQHLVWFREKMVPIGIQLSAIKPPAEQKLAHENMRESVGSYAEAATLFMQGLDMGDTQYFADAAKLIAEAKSLRGIESEE